MLTLFLFYFQDEDGTDSTEPIYETAAEAKEEENQDKDKTEEKTK